MKLIIFDLDQTLVDFVTVHDRAIQRLFESHFKVEARLDEIDFAGKSLIRIFSELAASKGIPVEKITGNGQELLKSYERFFGDHISEAKGDYILPGVKSLLDELAKTGNLIVLYTGDFAGIVNTVFQFTGLGKYFRFAVCGNEAKTRAGLVELAVERAEKLTGKKFKGKDIVIVGDSIRDIEAGLAFNALTIAVATGTHSETELARYKPDYLFKNLADYQKVVRVIG